MTSAPDPRDIELSDEVVGDELGLAQVPPVEKDLTEEEKGKPVHDLAVRELEHKGKFSLFGGLVTVEFSSGASVVGRALAWMVVVGIALGSGWAVDRLASSLTIGRRLTTLLVLVTGASVLIAGACYLEAKAPWSGSKPAKLACAALAALLLFGSGVAGGYALFAPEHSQNKPTITGDLYAVQPGDTLSDIAERWGDKGGFEDLVRKNRRPFPSGTDLARDPNLIHPGDVFTDVEKASR